MKAGKFFYSGIGIGCIALLILLYRFADPISAENVGFAYRVEQAVKAAIMAALGWIVWRFIAILWWDPWEKKHGKPMSRIIKDVALVFLILVDVIMILAVVYGQNPTGILISLGQMWTVVGGTLILACKDIVQDCVSGIILDFTGGYKVGDWIQLPNGTNAQVKAIHLRDTEFSLINGMTITLGNNEVFSKGLLNYNDADDGMWCDIRVTLSAAVPVDRARRILQAATASAPGVYNKEAKVMAKEAAGGCVTYMILYKVAGFAQKNPALHGVIQSLMKHLQDHNLTIATGAIKTYVGSEESEARDTKVLQTRQTEAVTMLRLSPLFAGCTDEEIEGIAPVFKMRVYRQGDIILAEKTRGSTMYFVAEGVVEISIQIVDETADDNASGSNEAKDKAAEPLREERFIRKHITFLATNDFFGEGGVMNNAPRNATVSAHTDVVAYELTRDDLRQILKERPAMLLKISEAMVARRQETADIANATLLDLQERRKMTNEFASALKTFLGLD